MVVQQRRCGGGALAVLALTAAGVMTMGSGCSGAGGDPGDGAGERVARAGPTGAPAAVVRRAADALAAAGSAETRTSMETAVGGTRVTIRGEGTYDFRRQLGRIKVVLPKDAAGAEEHRPITELLAPGALYMKNRGAGVPDDKWVRIDTTALEDGNLVTGGVTDPAAAAELLRGADKVTYVGRTELAGVAVRHYRGTADLGQAAREASPSARGALAAAAKGFSTDAVPFDAYLDDDGLLRKVRHRFTFATEGPAAAVVSTMLLYGFGTRVSVELPPEADIYTGRVQQSGSGPETP
uniref:Lipoprotein n=1 Tax=Streptomyces sp. NBC_01401 TaxID=2903854 RepID=A0AAU3GTC6_9ACTN